MNLLTSAQNPLIKEVKALKDKKAREDMKLFFIEGTRFVEEALKENVEIVRIFFSEQLLHNSSGERIYTQASSLKIDMFSVSDKLFKEISDTENPQGILAVIKIKPNNMEDVLKDNSFIVILDSIQDPGNVGTLIRTADAAGATGIIMSKGCVDLYNPKVLRSTMGSVFHIPVCFSDNLVDTLEALKARGIKVYASHLKGSRNYFDADMGYNTAIIVGNEAKGISDEVASHADVLVRIPMPGKAESLNASVAGSLLMYESVRQRAQGKE